MWKDTPLLSLKDGNPFWHFQPPRWLFPPPITSKSPQCKFLYTNDWISLTKMKIQYVCAITFKCLCLCMYVRINQRKYACVFITKGMCMCIYVCNMYGYGYLHLSVCICMYKSTLLCMCIHI